jgi:poly(beta-D-mannuronate) lyase
MAMLTPHSPSRRTLMTIALAQALAAGLGGAAHASSVIQGPFDRALVRRRGERYRKQFVAANPPAPVVDLAVQSRYVKDGKSETIDESAEAAYQERLAPIQGFANDVSKIADVYATAAAPVPDAAQSACRWLDAWAKAGALQNAQTDQAHAVIAWEVATIANAWWRVRDDETIEVGAKESIDRWLAGLAASTRAHFAEGQDKRSRNNNHFYWAGWSNLCVAFAVQDAASLAFARRAYAHACKRISPAGILPLELERGSRALQYHNFALAPLVLTGHVLQRNGFEVGVFADGSPLSRLADATLAGIADPSAFQALAGKPQTLDGIVWRSQLAWLEVYKLYVTDSRARPLLDKHRPMRSPRLGGDLTFYFSDAS